MKVPSRTLEEALNDLQVNDPDTGPMRRDAAEAAIDYYCDCRTNFAVGLAMRALESAAEFLWARKKLADEESEQAGEEFLHQAHLIEREIEALRQHSFPGATTPAPAPGTHCELDNEYPPIVGRLAKIAGEAYEHGWSEAADNLREAANSIGAAHCNLKTGGVALAGRGVRPSATKWATDAAAEIDRMSSEQTPMMSLAKHLGSCIHLTELRWETIRAVATILSKWPDDAVAGALADKQSWSLAVVHPANHPEITEQEGKVTDAEIRRALEEIVAWRCLPKRWA